MSTFVRSGYRSPGFQREADAFSSVLGLAQLTTVPALEYYAREPWTLTSVQTIPDNLHLQLDRLSHLDVTQRASWLRACYWLHHSSFIRIQHPRHSERLSSLWRPSSRVQGARKDPSLSNSSRNSRQITAMMLRVYESFMTFAPTFSTAIHSFTQIANLCRSE